MLLGTILGKNRVIAMEDHTYLTAYYDFLHIGYEVKAVKQDESGMCISSLKDSGAQIAYVMPSHQFPAGTVMPLKRRMALLDWAEEAENRYIIEDDYGRAVCRAEKSFFSNRVQSRPEDTGVILKRRRI